MDDDSGEINPYRELVVIMQKRWKCQRPKSSSGQY